MIKLDENNLCSYEYLLDKYCEFIHDKKILYFIDNCLFFSDGEFCVLGHTISGDIYVRDKEYLEFHQIFSIIKSDGGFRISEWICLHESTEEEEM